MKVHCALIEYANEKAKQADYLVQIVDYDDPYNQWQEWFSDRREMVTDLALARTIDFYNIFHQGGALIE